MGRRKIEIQPIANERNRSVTFLKRKNGLFKKAYELGVLCSVDVAVIVFETRPGHAPKLHQYSSSPDISRIVAKQLEHSGEIDTKYARDFAGRDIAEDDDEEDDLRGPPMPGAGPAGGGRKTVTRVAKRPGEPEPSYIQSNRSGMYPTMPDPPDRYSHSALRDAMHAQAHAITGNTKRPRLEDDVGDPARPHFQPPSTFYSVSGMSMGSSTANPGAAPPYMSFPTQQPPAPGMNFGAPGPMYTGPTGGGGRMDGSYRLPDLPHPPPGNGNGGLAGPARSSSPMVWPPGSGASGSAGPAQLSPATSSPHGSRPSSTRLSPGPSALPPPSALSAPPKTTSGGARLDTIISARNQPPSPRDGDGRSSLSMSRILDDNLAASEVNKRNGENGILDGGTKK